MTGGGEDDDTDFDIEDLQRMNCNRCKKIVMPGEGIRVKNYMVDSGVKTVAYCDQDCLDAMPSRGVRGRKEIQEKLQELKERDSGVVYEGSMGSIPARCTGEIRALKWVRGVRDDL